MKTVLIVQYHFLPFNNVGVKQFARYCKYLPHFGWRPVVLTRDWSTGPTKEDADWGLTFEPDALEALEPRPAIVGAPYRAYTGRLHALHEQLKGRTRPGSRGAQRLLLSAIRKTLSPWWPLFGPYPDQFAGWIQSAVPAGLKFAGSERIDAIMSNCPPQTDHVVAGHLARQLGVPWVPYFGDLYGFYIGPGDWHTDRWQRRLAGMLNRRWLQGASFALAASPRMVQVIHDLYDINGEVAVVGFDETDFPVRPTPQRHARFRLAHVGSIYPGDQRPDLLMDALDMLLAHAPTARDHIHVQLVGSRCEPELLRLLGGRPCQEVCSVEPKVPAAEAVTIMRQSDVLLLLNTTAGRPAGGTLSYPSKLFEYLGSQRPILAIPGDDDWVDRLLRTTQAGATVNSAEEAAQILETWYGHWLHTGMVPYEAQRQHVKQFTHRAQAGRIAAVLDHVTHGTASLPGPII